jgi:hypothetical protein
MHIRIKEKKWWISYHWTGGIFSVLDKVFSQNQDLILRDTCWEMGKPVKCFFWAGGQWLMSVILATQEDCGSKPAWANSSWDPISKNLSQKRAGGVAQGVGPEFKPNTEKKSFFSVSNEIIMWFLFFFDIACVCLELRINWAGGWGVLLWVVSPRRYLSPGPCEYDFIWKPGICSPNWVKMRSYWSRVGP